MSVRQLLEARFEMSRDLLMFLTLCLHIKDQVNELSLQSVEQITYYNLCYMRILREFVQIVFIKRIFFFQFSTYLSI